MAQALVMPKLGLTMTEGTIGKWLMAEGDPVTTGDKLYEVETDKLTNTIESTMDGTILKILAGEGDVIACLEPVVIIGAPGEDISALLPAGAAPSVTAPVAVEPAEQTSTSDNVPKVAKTQDGRIIASPAAKKLAKEKNVDLAFVLGTGPNDRIIIEDVEKYLANPTAATNVKASPLAAKMAQESGVALNDVPANGRVMSKDVVAYLNNSAPAQREEVVPMSAMRKVIAKRMSESVAISPTVTYDVSIDMSSMKAYKEQLGSEGIKASYTDLLVKIVSKALLEYPLLNCSIDGNNIILKRYVNMGFATALEDGLLVPVIKDAHLKSITEISSEIKSLAEQARSGSLGPDALSGGTFTITNLGMYGIESFSPIINQPEVAILGVNAIVDTLVLVNGQPVAKPMMRLSLTADHRAVDGSVAALFLARVKKLMEKPALLLA
jgi:pyruvate dehydrogenase E2 component (dihydrolipoamide acetyltransferase)